MEFDGSPSSPTGSLHIPGRGKKYSRVESRIFCLSDKVEHEMYRELLNQHATGVIDILHKKDYSFPKSEMLYMHVEWGIK